MTSLRGRLRSRGSKLALALLVTLVLPMTLHAEAQSFGDVLVPGAQWAGSYAQLGDLNVYSNGTGAQDQPGPFGPRYECTELAQRWAYYRYGETAQWPIGSAADMWNVGPIMPVPFLQNPNGGPSAPQFGDLLIFGATSYDPTGHAAVVSGATSTTVSIVEQNWGASPGIATLPISGTSMPPRWGLTVLGWLRASPPASLGGGPVPGSVHRVSTQPGQSELFWRGTDNNIWHMWNSGSGWSGAANLGVGTVASDPYPVSWGGGRVDVFWKGTDGGLWHAFYAPGKGWTGALSLGGSPLGSDPQPVSWGPGHLDVFWEGTGGGLWHSYYWGGTWTTTQSLFEHGLASTPHVISTAVGSVDLFWKGADGNLWQKHFTNGWQAAVSLGDGPLGGDPFPVSWAPGALDVFWRGTDGNVWHAWGGSGTWSGPSCLGGPIVGDPLPTSAAPGNIKVYASGPDNEVHQFVYQGSWFAPITLGDGPVTSPLTGGRSVAGHTEVYWVGANQGIWSASF